ADPAYRKLGDRINFAVHVAAFTAVNSILWFLHELMQGTLPWLPKFSGVLLGLLISHSVWVFAIANYSPSGAASDKSS
ncbi:MAG: hypothetical protein AAF959_14390, partial [Cyanobacteria bacterium P01_D01_bin.56]